MKRLVLFALVLPLFARAEEAQARILQGPDSVEVDERGVVVRAPDLGLSTLGGPTVFLEGACSEWFGVEFYVNGVLHEACGAGSEPDWAGREEVETVAFWWNDDRAVSRTRHGALEIRTELSWDPDGPNLLGHVSFTNGGPETIETVFYTREWRQPGEVGWSFPMDFDTHRAVDGDISRLVWMTDPILPGAKRGLRFSYRIGALEPATGEIEVPLRRWLGEDFPTGLNFGDTNGISWGDYDADGWPDVFALEGGRLWRNVQGMNWQQVFNANTVLPSSNNRYGSSFGDYDNDGLPDIGCEPRGGSDPFFRLLRNLGSADFVDVAGDPAIVDVQPFGPSETICWGDVDDDADLDMFLPVYPAFVAGPGNFFLENLGPVGPGGQYAFTETSAEAGLDNPPGAARPEGAQLVDVDFDGDVDLYCNGTLYQNVSVDGPLFTDATDSAGIGLRGALDEGAALFDYDMDGDFDLVIVYTNPGVRIWENRGDGSFFPANGLIDSPFTGLNLGLSAEDWDNDGDIDFTTREVFRRNLLVETGERGFSVASNNINPNFISSATPAWADWDKDGDLDCALGNWQQRGRFFQNITYDENTPESVKPYVRVRVMRDSDEVERGLETEYGANVEIVLAEDSVDRKIKKTLSSAAGYLNQNEYVLHFALPVTDEEGDPSTEAVFDVIVDFPGRPERGLLRVDRHVNPALAGIHLASLVDREIVVYRSGRVVLEGEMHEPVVSEKVARLRTTTNGLVRPSAMEPAPEPVPAPGPGHWVGIELGIPANMIAAHVKELILDGQAGSLAPCSDGDFNFAVWDVTDPGVPVRVQALALSTSERNDRSYFHNDLVLLSRRRYRLVARVTELRATSIPGPSLQEPVKVTGGLSYADGDPCSGAGAASAELDPEQVYLSVRYSRMTPGQALNRAPTAPTVTTEMRR